MIDESWVHRRLDSPLSASLVQAVEMSIATVGADVGAGRVFDAPMPTAPAYVSAGRLGVPQHQEPTIHAWPLDESSVFEQVRPRAPRAETFRLAKLLDGEVEQAELFGPVAECKSIVDTLGTTFPLEGPAWCLLILFRCDGRPPFDFDEFQRIERMRRGLAESLRRGYRYELPQQTPVDPVIAPDGAATATGEQPTSTTALLTRLSRTERRVLSFLRSRYTERQIAERMDRSPHTVHVHVKNIYRKFAVNSRRELIALFERQ